MEIRNSKSASNIKNKKNMKKFNTIDTSYSTSETAFRNKAMIKKNNSLKTFNKSNLKLNINSEHRVMTVLTSSEIDNIKQAILRKFEENKIKEKEYALNNNKSFHKEKCKKCNSKINNKNNKVNNLLNKIQKKFEKYNKENLIYKVNHDYQKLNFNTEDYEDLNFLERMELYSIRKNMKEEIIKNYIRLKTPKLSDNKIKQVFDDLTNDVNIRKEKKAKKEKEDLIFLKYNNNINNNSKNKKVNQKEMDEIIKRLSKPKKFFFNNINKEIDKDIKFRNGGKLKENKNNKKNKNNIIKSNSVKSIKKSEQINNINNRLYYKEINKKDLNYKLFMRNVNEILNINKNIKPKIKEKENKDFISYEQLKQIRNKNKMINIKSMNNNNRNIKYEYNFKDDEDNSLNNIKNKNINNQNDSNKYKGVRTQNNYNNNYNELFTFSRPQTHNSINNLKISIIIDNFFCNK